MKTTSLLLKEAELLLYFIRHKNTVLKRQDILKAIWGDDDYFMGRSLDVFISRLRKFLRMKNIMIENFWDWFPFFRKIINKFYTFTFQKSSI
jgi:DNA-binding response OmpR family regulator